MPKGKDGLFTNKTLTVSTTPSTMSAPTLPVATRVAVVGVGEWGANVAREFSSMGALAAVVDVDDARAAAAATLHRVPALDWQAVLRDPNIHAVAIASSARSHCALATAALEAGKHVLVEKPLGLSLQEGERVARAAREAGRRVVVGHIFQYHPAFAKMKELVRGGRLGAVRHIYSSRLSPGRVRSEESALWSLAPHDISMILSLVGGEAPGRVTAVETCQLRPLVADAVMASLRFPSGVDAQINVSWMHPEKERKLAVIGEAGSLIFDDTKDWSQKLVFSPCRFTPTADGEKPSLSTEGMEFITCAAAKPLTEECSRFVECIQRDEASPTDLEEGLAVLRVLEAIDEALALNRSATTSAAASVAATPQTETESVEAGCTIHETAVVDTPAEVGGGTQIWHFSHVLAGARIGRDCNIGQNVMVGRDVRIGDRCKVQNNVSIYEAVTLEDGVFCGPSCVFTNVTTPRAEIERKSEFRRTVVRRGATVGANATVLCGLEIGAYAMVGAGAVVTKPVAAYSLVVGNPARHIGWVGRAGERLGADMVCPRTGERYVLTDGRVQVVQLSKTALGPVPLIDLSTQRRRIQANLDRRMGDVLSRGDFIGGTEVGELEQRLSRYTGASHAVACASGTDALTLALLALGLRPNDAVLVPAFTFVASVEPVALLGAVPIFLDVEPESLTVDASLVGAGVQAATDAGLRPVGIIAVDIFGHPADYQALHAQAAEHGLWIIADAAQSFGASVGGAKVGSLATVTTTSFFPSKPLGCYGDGGAALTDDPALAQAMRSLQHHGRGRDKFHSHRVGVNSRLDTLQAAVLLAKMDVFADEVDARQKVAAAYRELLSEGVGDALRVPAVRPGCVSAWASYTIRCRRPGSRDTIQQRLQDAGVSTAVYYPMPVNAMDAYSAFPVANGSCPVAESAGGQVLSLPMHPYLELETQEGISSIIREAAPVFTGP